MATKHLDHGAYLYNNVAFTGNIASSSSTLTVTAMAPGSDPILPGTFLYCNRATFPAPNWISAQLTSTEPGGKLGGTGTYTMAQGNPVSQAATGVAFTGAGGFMQTPLATLYDGVDRWGKPQGGDGVGKAPSTSAATVEINFSSITCTPGQTITLCGAVLTAVNTGAAANQFNVGASATGSALVAAIIAGVNKSTTVVATNAPAEGWVPHRVSNALALRASPANAAILQIQTRIGSTVYNNNPLWEVSVGMTGAGGPYRFAGGASGCMGTFCFPFNLGFADNWFGLLTHYEGALLAGDVLKVRSHRRYQSGKQLGVFDTTCHLGWNQNTGSQGMPAVGARENPVLVEFDDGTEWPADTEGGTIEPTFRMYSRNSSTSNSASIAPVNSFIHFRGKRYASGNANAVLEAMSTAAYGVTALRILYGSNTVYENMDFFGTDYAWADYRSVNGGLVNGAACLVRNCRMINDREKPGYSFFAMITTAMRVDFFGCEFGQRYPSAAHNPVLNGLNASTSVSGRIYLEGCRFTGFLTGSMLFPLVALTTVGDLAVFMRNCDFGDINKRGPSLNQSALVRANTPFGGYGHFAASAYGNQEFFTDTIQGYVGWTAIQDQPCLNARLLNGKPWSIRMVPSLVADSVQPYHSLDTPRLNKMSSSTKVRKKLVVRMLTEKSLALTTRDVSLVVTYMGADGIVRTYSTLDNSAPVELVASASAWVRASNEASTAMMDDGGVQRAQFFDPDAGGSFMFTPIKLEFTTPTAVDAYSEVSCVVRLHRSITVQGQQIFVDPDITLEDVA